MVTRTWYGDEIAARADRACGRATIGMATRVVREMQLATHVESGTLKRSEHAAKPETMGEVEANDVTIRSGPDSWAVEMGSWLPYACVENSRGGAHRFADIGWQLAQPFFDRIMVKAWRDEGLE